MRVQLYGKHAKSIAALVEKSGFAISNDAPDCIITYGGDGTLLAAEREFPGVPKLPLRDSLVCQKCGQHTDEHMLQLLWQQKLPLHLYQKVRAVSGNATVVGLNDIVVRNAVVIHALRFSLTENETEFPNLFIGDGIVVATPFGATGYYHAITRHVFTEGFRCAFNNPVSPQEPLTLPANFSLTVSIVRGPATVSADNNPDILEIPDQQHIRIEPAGQFATIFDGATLRCTSCIVQKEKRLHA